MSSKKSKRIAAGRKAAEQKKTESKSEGQVLAEEANKEKDGKLLKVARKDAVALLGAIGFKDTRRYENALLTKRLGKLKIYMESYEGTLDGDSQELVDKIIKAGPDGITVTGEEPKGAKKDAGEGKSTKPAGKGKASGERKARKPRDGGPSNKEQVWNLYQKVTNKDKAGEKVEAWFKEINEAVKLSTIRGWIGDWNRGTNLPGCAKKRS